MFHPFVFGSFVILRTPQNPRPIVCQKEKDQENEILTSSQFKNELKEKNKDSIKLPKTVKNVKSLSNKENPTPEPRSRDQETECIICGESFVEERIQCHTCKDWAHEACVDINTADLY